MSGSPDYSSYHLHELEQALKDLDEAAKPEEARAIREHIAKGGYVYPTEPPTEKIAFINAAYKWALVGVLGALALFNLAAFVLTLDMRALIPLVLQGALLLMIRRKHKHTRALIKVWSALLIASALLQFMAMHYAPELEAAELAEHVVTLVVGLAFLLLADRCVSLIPVDPNKPMEPAR
jgi:hypothetical protein